MINLYNIQKLKECFEQLTEFYVLDIIKAIKFLGTIEQYLDDTIIRKLQAENNIQLKYTSMEEQLNVTDKRITTSYFTLEMVSRMIQFR